MHACIQTNLVARTTCIACYVNIFNRRPWCAGLTGKYGCHSYAAKYGDVNHYASWSLAYSSIIALLSTLASTLLGYFLLLTVSALNASSTQAAARTTTKKSILGRKKRKPQQGDIKTELDQDKEKKMLTDKRTRKSLQMFMWWKWCGQWMMCICNILLVAGLFYMGIAMTYLVECRWHNEYWFQRCKTAGWKYIGMNDRADAEECVLRTPRIGVTLVPPASHIHAHAN